jgi:glutathione peroxidase
VKQIFLLAGITFIALVAVNMFTDMFGSKASAQEADASIFDFKAKSLEGKEVDFAHYKGKYLLIVNTASKCGYTPQFADLEKLHEQYGDKVKVLGFPANNFLWQEPGSSEEIATFCERNYGVKFQMFEKVSVKGKDKAPIYKWLTAKSGETPSWNFCKYLINPEGKVIGFYSSKVSPLDAKIVSALK